MKYNTIQEIGKIQFNKSIKSCWIADVKRKLGLTKRPSYNRINSNSVKYPCPEGDIKMWLIEIFKSTSSQN